MCGIAGFTHRRSRPDPDLIHRATQSIVHRGPDQQGVFESDTVSLGAVRLRIIDLAGGRQPMHAGGCVIVFNGEVYNHAEIREELIAKGHHFESKCDTEAVLRAFLEWDTASFQKLRGMFAFAIWDESQKRLVLCRDRMGIKPLYLYEQGEDLYFGSELKTLFALPGVERRLDAEGLSHYLSLNWVPAPFTLAEGVRKLDPGEWLEWIDGRVTQRKRYWTLQFEPNDRMQYSTAREELDSLLRASMREHLVSDVPLGIWASGGIDSSTVLHYAAEAAGRKLQTFSVSFKGRKFDESPYFREIAEKYGTDHHEFDLNPEQDLSDAIEQLTHYSDEPSADAGALPVWFLSKMTRRHVTVSLSGEGADELFGGYETYKADNYAAVARLFPALGRRMGLAVAQSLPVSDEKIGFEYKAKRFLAGTLQTPVAAHLYWNGTFSQSEKERLMTRNGFPATGAYVDSRTPETHAFANRAMWIDQLHYLPDDILYKCDRMSMAHSLEVRPPFLDHRIVEFAARLPQRFKIRGSKLKFILKDLMRDKLPQGILNRPKQGFDIPTHHWLRTSLKPLFMDTVNKQSIEATGVIRWTEVERVIADHMNRKANYGYHLWGLLMLCSWMKRWSVNASR